MDKDHIKQLALQDADTETEEGLTAAANMYDKLTRNRTQATMVQDDIMGTPLPNGLLQWFGYDFEHVDLPDTPLLKHGDNPVWVGTLHGFVMTNRGRRRLGRNQGRAVRDGRRGRGLRGAHALRSHHQGPRA